MQVEFNIASVGMNTNLCLGDGAMVVHQSTPIHVECCNRIVNSMLFWDNQKRALFGDICILTR